MFHYPGQFVISSLFTVTLSCLIKCLSAIIPLNVLGVVVRLKGVTEGHDSQLSYKEQHHWQLGQLESARTLKQSKSSLSFR